MGLVSARSRIPLTTQQRARRGEYKQDIKQYGTIVIDPPCLDGR
jgi:hypothetical protein